MVRTKKTDWKKGHFRPLHPEKCLNVQMNKTPIVFRSSYEQRFFTYCDSNKNIVRWGSELFEIPYIYSLDKKLHKYFPDVYIEVLDKEGNLKKYLIEIKPKKQLAKPKPPKNKTRQALKNYKYAANQWIKNNNKWHHAKMFCESRDWNFRVFTEDDLF